MLQWLVLRIYRRYGNRLLASEGIIRKYEDIDSVWVQEKEGFVHVTTTKVNPYYEQMQNKRYITSCCGMSRQGFVFANDALSAKNEGCPCTGSLQRIVFG